METKYIVVVLVGFGVGILSFGLFALLALAYKAQNRLWVLPPMLLVFGSFVANAWIGGYVVDYLGIQVIDERRQAAQMMMIPFILGGVVALYVFKLKKQWQIKKLESQKSLVDKKNDHL